MNLQLAFWIALAIFSGALGGIHVPINGALSMRIQSTMMATWTFYGIAFALNTVWILIYWDRSAFMALASVPRWYFIAGVISLVVVASGTYLMPRLGAVNVFVLVLSSQMILRMVISHFGWLDSPIAPINIAKLIGALFLILGAILVVRN